jgi:hypothetical protein
MKFVRGGSHADQTSAYRRSALCKILILVNAFDLKTTFVTASRVFVGHREGCPEGEIWLWASTYE